MNDELLEPLVAYKTVYKDAFLRNTEECFDSMLKQSCVDVDANRKTVGLYDAEKKSIEEVKNKIGTLKGLRELSIFGIIVGAGLAIGGICSLDDALTAALLIIFGLLLIVALAIVIGKVINPKIKQQNETKEEHEKKAEEYFAEAQKQMAPLNALFDDNLTKDLIEKTVPILNIDDNFNVKRYELMSEKYGFTHNDANNRSTIGIMSGEILGNPFIVDRELVQYQSSQSYTGTLLITWTTVGFDKDGNTVTYHHSQTLFASVVKPKPAYRTETRLIYANEVAPTLQFSRKPSHVEDLSENARERKVRAGAKKLQKMHEKNVESGFTQMGNEEFDVLFAATDRNDEVQFRLLFTPLAQKNMLALLEDADGYGDDFAMRKANCLNYIISEHSKYWDMETSRSRYYSHSVDLAKQNFVKFNCDYFRSLYFDFAPLLSIPLYQQHKPHEYIYKENYERNFTDYETEYAANNVGMGVFSHPEAATQSVLKTEFIDSNGKSDRVAVTAHSFRTEERVDFVPTLGGDGELHPVPVYWTEYIPVSRTTDVMLKELGLTEKQFDEPDEQLLQAQTKHGQLGIGYGHKIVCCVTDDDEFENDFHYVNGGKTNG